jgi:surface antigen
MSSHSSLVTLFAVVTLAILLAGQILLGPTRALGGEWETSVSQDPGQAVAMLPTVPGTSVDIPLTPQVLDEKDEIAALERIQYALSEVGDGKTYVWRRWHGRLSGLVQPTASFKEASGKVCRHLVVLMTTGKVTKKQEGIACRLPSGRWQLDG